MVSESGPRPVCATGAPVWKPREAILKAVMVISELYGASKTWEMSRLWNICQGGCTEGVESTEERDLLQEGNLGLEA